MGSSRASKPPAANYRGVIRNYVGGEWVASSATTRQQVVNPATGQALAEVPLGTAQDVEVAVAAAQAAFSSWRQTPPQQRVQPLYRLKRLMEQNHDQLARTVTEEHGKTLEDARGAVQRAIENVEVACGIPSLMMGYGLEDGASRGIDEEVIRQPLGVFAAVCPFNFPAMVPFWFLPYAVACGNSFIVKPSEQVPLTQRAVFELIAEAGFPPGVLNLVNGAREVVDALLDHPLIKGVSFVGSTPVARYVYRRAAENGKRVQAQGGAKNVLVLLPDAVLEKTVPNVMGASFGSAGQRCLAGSLAVTVADKGGRAASAIAEAARALRVGNGFEAGVDVGPVISDQAQERILAAIQRGVDEGARLIVDGRGAAESRAGFFVGPTVFDQVRPDMSLAQQEIFGPVLGIVAVDTVDQALEIIERLPFGNAASIFTQDGKAAREFHYRAPVGNVGINVGVAAPMAYFPFSGWKDSFFGTLHGQGRDAIDFFTDRKVVITRWF
ncbi:MAG TPA: CoA-acylating methylmalonate-semialdehyde dehydrogenase [Chloroflexota bacterium]|nr:CoA-acylating methylmalonate-semialdehyde dehydrogenase [Chloroflexota bacterium]